MNEPAELQGRKTGELRRGPLADRPPEAFGATASADFQRLLNEQRDRFEFSTAASDIGYWFCDLPFDKLIWDSRVKRHFWLAPDTEVDIHLFYRQIHPDDREPTRQAIETSINSHNRYDIEYRTVSPEGEIRWIRAIGRTAYDSNGRAIRFDGVTQDVTELKVAQQALDAERQRLTAVFQNVPIGLVFAEADGRVISGNPQAERTFRFAPETSEQPRPHEGWNLFDAEGQRVPGSELPLCRALEDGGTHRAEYLACAEDGTLKWVELTGAPIFDVEGNISGGIVASVDIDARKRAEQALLRSEKLAAVGRLASTIAHEINNPLESVVNLVYLIQQLAKDPVLQAYAQTAQEELARVSHIVTHSLRFNRQTNAPHAERISRLIESAVAIYEPRITRSGSTLMRDYAEDDVALCLPSELRQVFSNLIGNAFDAIKGRGIIRIRTRLVHGPADERCVRVTVADSGCGMDEAARTRLFEAFFSTKGDNGTGLGLWISNEIPSRHSAKIRVRSSQQAGRTGTTFCIWLPIHPEVTSYVPDESIRSAALQPVHSAS
ncbi:two-component system sensor histidine kinase NtrB [Terriglobus aquaticus]|uniref:histidine kinase n=1 Tax=Terriglobus aquaticus TaxID=940139 RepID=A0ABW9KKG1_9BACT|nr:PAS domain-containing protein [Terriglobus aquaticus]